MQRSDKNGETAGPVTSSTGGEWRFRIGATILVLGFASPAAIPLVARSGLDSGLKTLLSGALAVGLPEIMMVAATAIMGRSGFTRLKNLIGGFAKKYGPAEQVSAGRYRMGLAMFVAPILLGVGGPYLGSHIPTYEAHPIRWALGGDLVFFGSFFVLGGEFWEKLRSLFVHGATAVFPDAGSES